MSVPKITHYTVVLTFGTSPTQAILLYEDNQQVGALTFTSPALFGATVDMLRNGTGSVIWDTSSKQLTFALQPAGAGEPG